MKNKFFKICALTLVILTLGTTVACKHQFNALMLSDGYKRNVYDNFTVSDAFCNSAKSFAMKLFSDTVSSDKENSLISPFSAFYCLALVANGADGETLSQIEQALNIDISTLNESAYAFANSIYSSSKCKFSLANSVWYNNSDAKLNVKPEFLQTNADWYSSDIFASEFDYQTIKDINNWCSDKTFNMINEIISEISPETIMYLFNAIAFDSEWAEKYKKSQIHDGIFRNYNGSTSDVEMLCSSENVYFEYENAVGFAKNYSGNAYSFIGILPDDSTDIYEFAGNMDVEFWNSFFNSKTFCSVNLNMPEFTFATELMDFTAELKNMGITKAFESSEADFRKMGTSPLGNIYVNSVFQKAFIEVSRNGTKAAAITGADMNAESAAPTEIKDIALDRPFIYAIVDNKTNIPLFIGITANIG